MYDGVVREVEMRFNLLKTAYVAVAVSDALIGEEVVEFLMEMSVRLVVVYGDDVRELGVYVVVYVMLLRLVAGDLEYVKRAVTEGDKEVLEVLLVLDLSVSVVYYYVVSWYYKVWENYVEFYKLGMLYLAYVSCEMLFAETRAALSVDLCFVVLFGENVYNFVEFFVYLIVESLNDGFFVWLMDVVKVFNEGDLYEYD